MKQAESIRIHVTADERYELFLDGERVGRGPERVAPDRWYYESYNLDLKAGEHTFVAPRVGLGRAGCRRPDVRAARLLLAAECDWGLKMDTGSGDWRVNCWMATAHRPALCPLARGHGGNRRGPLSVGD